MSTRLLFGNITIRTMIRRILLHAPPGLFVLDEVHHNFLMPHVGMGRMAPAKKAGITMPRTDRLLALIRCAADSRFNFARCDRMSVRPAHVRAERSKYGACCIMAPRLET